MTTRSVEQYSSTRISSKVFSNMSSESFVILSAPVEGFPGSDNLEISLACLLPRVLISSEYALEKGGIWIPNTELIRTSRGGQVGMLQLVERASVVTQGFLKVLLDFEGREHGNLDIDGNSERQEEVVVTQNTSSWLVPSGGITGSASFMVTLHPLIVKD